MTRDPSGGSAATTPVDASRHALRARHFGPGIKNPQSEALLRSRFSARAFSPVSVDDVVLDAVLDLAGTSPSWCNTQPWGVYAITDDALAALASRFSRAAQHSEPAPEVEHPGGYSGAHLDRRRASGHSLYESLGIDRSDHAARSRQALRNLEFFDAPCALIVTVPRYLGPYALVDAGAYLTTIQLAAQCYGLASVPQAALSMYPNTVRSVAPIPDSEAIVYGVSLGYPLLDDPANTFSTDRDNLPVRVREPVRTEHIDGRFSAGEVDTAHRRT